MTPPRVAALFVDRPWPGVTGDMQRVRALVGALRAEAEVRVVLAPAPGPAGRPPTGVEVVEHERRPSAPLAAARFLRGLPGGRPPMMAFYRQGAVRRAVAADLGAFDPAVVLTHHLGGAAILDGLVDPARVVLDLPNDEVQRFGRMAALGGAAGRVRFGLEQRMARRWLAGALPRYRAVTVVSDEDADAYRRLAPGARVVVVPNGTDPPPAIREDPGGRAVVFLGDLAYPPNRDGVEWFIERVLPSAPVDELRVVGRGEVAAAARVTALGFVDDLAAELDRAVAMVVPLRVGGGTRLKVLEAFGRGLPVVSTRLGVEGLGAEPGTHYLAAETSDEWASVLGTLLDDVALRARLAAAGRALVDARFTWSRATAPLRALVGAEPA